MNLLINAGCVVRAERLNPSSSQFSQSAASVVSSQYYCVCNTPTQGQDVVAYPDVGPSGATAAQQPAACQAVAGLERLDCHDDIREFVPTPLTNF